MKYQSK